MRYIFTFNHKHPDKDAVSIDYGLTNIMLPTVLMGSVTGVFLNILLPPVILQVSMFCLLFFLAVNSTMKAVEIFKKESKQKND